VETVVRLKSAQLHEKSIILEQEISEDVAFVSCDPGQVEQVLINLINNAIDALGQTHGAVLKIVVGKVNDKTHIQVIDNGNGIDPEDLGKIFIPFFSTKNSGMGIGLSLSKQIMRMHGGSIRASSLPGKQTVFLLEFPGVE
jgi:signal transduction histidine kinase